MATRDRSGRGHGGDGRFIRTIETAERDAQACRLRSQGRSYAEIADELGMPGRGGREQARRAVQRALQATVAEPAAEVRTLELLRLDALWVQAWAVLQRGHLAHSAGKVVLDPRTGEPVRDDAPVLGAIDRLLRIQERRARLLGLDAPSRTEVVTVDAVEAEIARLAAELGMAGADR